MFTLILILAAIAGGIYLESEYNVRDRANKTLAAIVAAGLVGAEFGQDVISWVHGVKDVILGIF
jgi:hypothetical protein